MQYQNDYLQQQPQQQYQQPAAQPQQPQAYAQVPQEPQPEAQSPAPGNSATFTADVKVLEYIQLVHPELASAMINIAIKKFVETDDFWNYFVKDEFRAIAQKEQLLKDSNPKKEEEKKEEPPIAAAMDFSAGW
jgi:hypothetical protein